MEQLIPIFVTQLVSTIAIIFSNRTEIAWIKETLKQHHERLTSVEKAST